MTLNEVSKQLSGNNNHVMELLKDCSKSLLETVESFVAYAFDNDLKCEFEDRLTNILFDILTIAGKENINIEKLLEEKLK